MSVLGFKHGMDSSDICINTLKINSINMRHNMFTGQEMAKDTLLKDPVGIGNRGPHRWSLGGLYSLGHMLHRPEWVHLILQLSHLYST